MKIHVLKLGALDMPMNILYGSDYPEDQSLYCPMYALAIETEIGVILFDTGVNTDPGYIETYIACGNHFDLPEDALINQLNHIGIRPDDVKYIVLSHLHYDHAGNITRFPNAQVLVSRKEFYEVMAAYGRGESDLLIPAAYVELWAHSKVNWLLVGEQEVELCPGIKVYNFGAGHSFGMLSVLIESKELGNILAVSDMAYTQKSFDELITPGILLDEEGYVNGLKQAGKIAKLNQATIWCGHDPDLFTSLRWAPQGFYE